MNGLQAVQMVQSESFDLIFMDCAMPVMDGYQATQTIREIPNIGNSIPIVAMTAHAMVKDREKSLAAGMNEHLTKPIRFAEIKAIIEKYFGTELASEEN